MIKPTTLRNPKYLKSFMGGQCVACGRLDETVVGAHIRYGHGGGMGFKPADDLVLPLCGPCHAQCDQSKGEAAFWLEVTRNDPWFMMSCIRALARERYREWKDG